jgi:hypothetical protein
MKTIASKPTKAKATAQKLMSRERCNALIKLAGLTSKQIINAVELVLCCGYTPTEAATILQMPHQHIYRALSKLKKAQALATLATVPQKTH